MSLPGGLELGWPTALYGLLLGLPILLLHLHHRRRVRLVVPYLGLIRESLASSVSPVRFKRLRDTVPLVLRLVALLALVLALAGLRPASADAPTGTLWVIVDADVTTAAEEADGRTRWAHAVELARGLAAAHGDAPVGVAVAGTTLRTVLSPGTPASVRATRLAAALERVAPAAVDVDLGQALRALPLVGGEARRVVLISARPLEALSLGPEVGEVEVLGAGRTRADQRLSGLAVKPEADGLGYRVSFRVHNDAAEAVTRALELRVGDEVRHAESLELSADGEVERSLRLEAPEAGAWLEVALGGRDAFARNDRGHAWLAPPLRPSVLVVHAGDGVRPYTLAATLGMADLVDPKRSGVVAATDLADAPRADVVIVDGAPITTDALRPGGWIFLAPLAGALPFETGRRLDTPVVWRMDEAHPLLRRLELASVRLRRATALRGDGLVPLAHAAGEVVLAEGERDGVRYVAVGTDPEASDLWMKPAWPILLRRAVLRLARQPARPLPPLVEAGQSFGDVAAFPAGRTASLRWTGPDGTTQRMPIRLDGVQAGASVRVPAGLNTRARVEAPGDLTLPVGIVDLPAARRIVPARSPAAVPAAVSRPRLDERALRFVLIALGLGFLTLDLILSAKRRKRLRGG